MKRSLVLILTLGCLLGAAVFPTQAWGNCSQFYRVQPGDSLARIARIYGTTFTYLASINGISNPNRIFWGQVICVALAPPPPTTYVVQRGDWLSLIAMRFGVSLFDLMRANNIMNPNLIFPGQVLIIPGYGNGQVYSTQQQYAPPANGYPMNQPNPPVYGGGSMNPPPPVATTEASG